MKEERKLQQMGNAYTLYLPSAWVAQRGLSRGATVFVAEGPDGSLTLSTKKRQFEKLARIEATGEPEEALHAVVSAYIAGASEIELSGKHSFSVASEARNRLSGVELVGEEKDRFKLGVFVDYEDVSQRDLLKRLNAVTTSVYSMVGDVLKGAKVDAEELERRDDNVDRLYLMTLRVCYQSSSSFESVSNALAGKSIERICDHVHKIGIEPRPAKEDLPKLMDFYHGSWKIYERAFESLMRHADSHSVCIARRDFKEQALKALAKKPDTASTRFIHHCARVSEYASDIAEITGDIIQRNALAKA